MYYWKGIWEKVGKVIGMNAYTTNDEASHWILNKITLVCVD
jgi:hypothetical protein